MSLKKDYDALFAEMQGLKKECSELQKINKNLSERLTRKAAQAARKKVCNENTAFFDNYRQLTAASYLETAISIFQWENIPVDFKHNFTSKRIELQVARFGNPYIFRHEYRDKDLTNNRTERVYKILPAVPIDDSMDDYGEFHIVKPYAASGNTSMQYEPQIVNETCVPIFDFFRYATTNCNTSLSVQAAIELYVQLMSECEAAKRRNRKVLQLPFLFAPGDTTDRDRYNKFITEVQDILMSTTDGAEGIASEFVTDIQVLEMRSIYYGEELEGARKHYEDELFSYLGIGTNLIEKKERVINAEIKQVSDMHNINITKRQENRDSQLDILKTIFPDDWSGAEVVTKLENYNESKEAINNDSSTPETDNNGN